MSINCFLHGWSLLQTLPLTDKKHQNMPGRFLEIPVSWGDCFIMPHPVYTRSMMRMLLIIVKLSDVERRQNRQKLGCMPFCVVKIFDGWGPCPIDRPDGAWSDCPSLDPPVCEQCSITRRCCRWRNRR